LFPFQNSLESLKKNGIDWVQDLGRKNVEDLLTIIQWNEDNVNSFTIDTRPLLIANLAEHSFLQAFI
jgi:UV DNA damage endonuclease